MRILLVNTRHFRGGGDSTYTFNLADLLRREGHEVAFFAMRDQRNLPDPNGDLFVSHVDFKELNRRKNPLTGLRVLGRVIYSREARHKFRQLLGRFQPNIVHLQNIHAHITPSVIFEAKQCRLPVVWTLHDYKLICPNSHFLVDTTGAICEACSPGRFYHAPLKRCKKGSLLASTMAALEAYAHRLMRLTERVDAFIAPSAFLRGKLLERGFPPGKVHHLPLVLPEAAFHEGSTNDGYLLFLGKLELIKGIFPLLEACRLAPSVKLIMAGAADDPIAVQLPSLLPSNAQYVGMKNGRELQDLVRGALAIVLPSLTYENQPFSILEAFAAGKPVVASKLGGMIELLASGERGLLVPPGDARALANAMLWLTANPLAARTMGENAYRYCRATHTADRHLASLMALYAMVK